VKLIAQHNASDASLNSNLSASLDSSALLNLSNALDSSACGERELTQADLSSILSQDAGDKEVCADSREAGGGEVDRDVGGSGKGQRKGKGTGVVAIDARHLHLLEGVCWVC